MKILIKQFESAVFNIARLKRPLGLFAILLFFSVCSFAQKTWIGDTTFWYKFKQAEYKQIGLNEISGSQNLLTVRFSSSNNVVDLWTSDFKEFGGQQVFFTSTFDQKKRPTREYFASKVAISPDTARILYDLLIRYNVLSMPSCESIRGWKKGIDGGAFVLESSTPEKYSFKKYLSPSAVKKVPEAVLITEFISKAEALLKKNHRIELFFSTLPANCYSYGNMSTKCFSQAERTVLIDVVKSLLTITTNGLNDYDLKQDALKSPFVLLDGKLLSTLDSLKGYKLSDIEEIALSFEDSPAISALYGSRAASNGVIRIRRKRR